MDSTPHTIQNISDSGCISGSFEASRSLFNSTPNELLESTPVSNTACRKRKQLPNRNVTKKLSDIIGSCPSTPQFSSTMNDSVLMDFENVHIQQNCHDNTDTDNFHPTKLFKNSSTNAKFRSTPNTPEKQVCTEDVKRKPNSFIKYPVSVEQSPLKEANQILYPNIKTFGKTRKILSPQKFKESFEKNFSPAKKCLFTISRKELLNRVLTNNIVMKIIFENLSSGDLYRVSMVSKSFKDALESDSKALARYLEYKEKHKKNKENYKITPPGSPEVSFQNPPSPGSRNFYEFHDIAKNLPHNQSLTKCPRCLKPSIVENNVGQCQEIHSCGYIYCRLCGSSSNNPEDFVDKCKTSKLQTISSLPRPKLCDLSNLDNLNCENSFFSTSFNNSASDDSSSGFYSEYELSSVKRNLSFSFVETPKILCVNNNRKTVKPQTRVQRRSSVVPVMLLDKNDRKTIEVIEPSSPPKVKNYAVCSKQSRKNLKRLTR